MCGLSIKEFPYRKYFGPQNKNHKYHYGILVLHFMNRNTWKFDWRGFGFGMGEDWNFINSKLSTIQFKTTELNTITYNVCIHTNISCSVHSHRTCYIILLKAVARNSNWWWFYCSDFVSFIFHTWRGFYKFCQFDDWFWKICWKTIFFRWNLCPHKTYWTPHTAQTVSTSWWKFHYG